MKKNLKSIYITCMVTVLLLTSLSTLSVFGAETPVSDKLVAITFDDGPGPDTGRLLDALKQRNVKATFFVVGYKLDSYRETILREYNEGHQVASHSWNHPKLTSLSVANLQKQINDTAAGIRGITGQTEVYLRPPYGSYNATVKSYAGGPMILWNVDPLDWKYKNAETVKNNILKATKDGSIILVHDIHSTSVDGAIAAIDALQAQGYEFVTVSELLRRRGITPENGGVYSSAPNKGINLPGQDSKAYDGAYFDESKLETHWAYPSIQFVKERGIINGVTPDSFAPDKYMSKAVFLSALARWSGDDLSSYTAEFEDVKSSAWYAPAVGWGIDKGIVIEPKDGKFQPDTFLDKETLLTMLYHYAQYRNITLPDYHDAPPFADEDKISPWAKEAIKEFHDAGLPMESGVNTLGPKDKATRAQAAAFIHNFILGYGEGESPAPAVHKANGDNQAPTANKANVTNKAPADNKASTANKADAGRSNRAEKQNGGKLGMGAAIGTNAGAVNAMG